MTTKILIFTPRLRLYGRAAQTSNIVLIDQPLTAYNAQTTEAL